MSTLGLGKRPPPSGAVPTASEAREALSKKDRGYSDETMGEKTSIAEKVSTASHDTRTRDPLKSDDAFEPRKESQWTVKRLPNEGSRRNSKDLAAEQQHHHFSALEEATRT